MLRHAILLVVLVGCTNGDSSPPDASSGDAAKSDATKPQHDAGVPINHRPTAVQCPTERGPGPATQPYDAGLAGCASDSDCDAGLNGRCFPFEGLVGPGGCSYDQCLTDSTCAPETPCACRTSPTDNTANVCDTGGNCAVDSDCGDGGFCSPSARCGTPAYFCHTNGDWCVNDSDCPPVVPGSPCSTSSSCVYDPTVQHWDCTQLVCCPP